MNIILAWKFGTPLLCMYSKKMKYVQFATLQMRKLFCQKLAACLCMKPPSSPSVEPPLIYTKNRGVVNGNHFSSRPLYDDLTPFSPTTNAESMKILLEEIRDLLKTQVHNEKSKTTKMTRKMS